jgi:hypothetical protein
MQNDGMSPGKTAGIMTLVTKLKYKWTFIQFLSITDKLKVQKKLGLQLNGTHHLLVSADD